MACSSTHIRVIIHDRSSKVHNMMATVYPGIKEMQDKVHSVLGEATNQMANK